MAKPKILLVDDTKLVLELEKGYLKFSNVDVITAANGQEALDLVRTEVPDLIFMDMHMPVLNGIGCCRKIKADPFFCEIPVVMLTTAGREEDRELAAQAGCDDYLTKPIDRCAFLEMARRFTAGVDRRVPRVPCRIPVLVVQEGLPVAAESADLAEGGAFITWSGSVEKDTEVKVAFFLPVEGDSLVEATARVAWVNSGEERVKPALPPGFGVEFSLLEEKSLAALKRFVQGSME
ncbi:response regulator [Geomonas sp. RF6]|uniref:response regulator n=1 Tax=Geomonas sp. RF6 TaxID=2897342 RepID=UPI001E547F2F|nr:response regulator [Geomonas sp. RF6]UFS71499.1 response regulator [Geomonas sp. RF6]